jgi:hypothetical protein
MKQLDEFHAELNLATADRVTLLLDASESASARQDEIVSLAQGILTGLPVGVGRALYFLGNPTPYAPEQLAARSSPWFIENRRRASLVTPVWDVLPDEPGVVVVIGAGPLYDLPDWAETPILARTLLVTLGDSLQDERPLTTEIAQPRVSDLLGRLYDPIVRVEVAEPGWMPLWWQNPGYRLVCAADGVSLVAERLSDYHLPLGFLAPAGHAPTVILNASSGARSQRSLAQVERRPPPAPVRGELGPAEAAIARRAVQHASFTCAHCGREHAWDTLRCTAGAALLGEIIYPTLREFRGFVLLRVAEDRVTYTAAPGPVLPLGPGEVAVYDGAQAVLYHYEPQHGEWRRTGEALAPYARLAEELYVVLL